MFAGTPFGEALLAESLALPRSMKMRARRRRADGFRNAVEGDRVAVRPIRSRLRCAMKLRDRGARTAGRSGSESSAGAADWKIRCCGMRRENWTGCRGRFPAAVWSGRSTLLVALAALLLVVLVFLSVTGEPPRWPLAMMGGAAVCVGRCIGDSFTHFRGASPGCAIGADGGDRIRKRKRVRRSALPVRRFRGSRLGSRALSSCFLVCEILLRQPELQRALLLWRELYEADAQISPLVLPCDFCLGLQARAGARQCERDLQAFSGSTGSLV